MPRRSGDEKGDKKHRRGCCSRISLRTKTVWILIFLGILPAAVTLGIAYNAFAQAYIKFDNERAVEKGKIVVSGLIRNIHRAERFAEDYALERESFAVTTEDYSNHVFSYYNLAAFFTANGTLSSYSYAPNDPQKDRDKKYPAPPELAGLIGKIGGRTEYSGVFSFENYQPMIGALRPVHHINDTKTIYGYVLFAVNLNRRLADIGTVAQGCLSFYSGYNITTMVGENDNAYHTLSAKASPDMNRWADNVYVKMFDIRNDGASRTCPGLLTDNSTRRKYEAVWLLLRDPIDGHAPGPLIRIVHTCNLRATGKMLMASILGITIPIFAVYGVITFLYLNYGVLRQLNRLSGQLKSSIAEARSSSPERGDEVSRLELLLRYRLKTLTKEFDDAADDRRNEIRSMERLDEALDLMNILSGRETSFPANELLFQPAVSESSTPDEPRNSSVTISLHGLYESPIAVQFLKAHLVGTGADVGVVLFLMDVMQLVEETTADRRLIGAAQIYCRYLSSRPTYKIDLRHSRRRWVKDAIRARTDAAAVSLIQSITDEIVERLERGALARWERSEDYPHLLMALRTERGGELSGDHIAIGRGNGNSIAGNVDAGIDPEEDSEGEDGSTFNSKSQVESSDAASAALVAATAAATPNGGHVSPTPGAIVVGNKTSRSELRSVVATEDYNHDGEDGDGVVVCVGDGIPLTAIAPKTPSPSFQLSELIPK